MCAVQNKWWGRVWEGWGANGTDLKAKAAPVFLLSSQDALQNNDAGLLAEHSIVLPTVGVLDAGWAARIRGALAVPDDLQRPLHQRPKQGARLLCKASHQQHHQQLQMGRVKTQPL